MKLGLSMWSYVAAWNRKDIDISGFIRESKRLGVDGVELLDYFWRDQVLELPAAEAALRETGLPVGVYSVGNDLVTPDAAKRTEQVKIITDGVDMARRFGAGVVRVFSGNLSPGMEFDTALGWIVEGLKEAADYAQASKVTLALENHGLLAGRSDQVQMILNNVGSTALRANPDTGNFLLVGQSPEDAVRDLASKAAMVHFKDFRRVEDDYAGAAYTAVDGGKFVGTIIGDGDVALDECIAALKDAEFSGWVNIEYESEEDPFVGVPRSVQKARMLLSTN